EQVSGSAWAECPNGVESAAIQKEQKKNQGGNGNSQTNFLFLGPQFERLVQFTHSTFFTHRLASSGALIDGSEPMPQTKDLFANSSL
uniref:hypothetical protein n=3 Tax=Pseudomonas aeruginosa TaxID=287 RepID=UPI001C49F4D2